MNFPQKMTVKNGIIATGFLFLIVCYCWFIYLINGNSIIYDEIRIVADFFSEFQQSDTIIDKIRALFRRENETFPAFIRLLYLLSFWIFGNVRFDWLAYVANGIPIVFLLLFFAKRNTFQLPASLLLISAFILLNPYSDHIFLFTYASLFYFISILFPIGIVFSYAKKADNPLVLLLIILGLSSSTYFIIGLMVLVFSVFQKRWFTAKLLLVTLTILKIIPILLFNAKDETDKAGVIWQSFHHIPELIELFFLTLGSWIQVFNIEVLHPYAFAIGLSTFLAIIYLLVLKIRREPTDPLTTFYGLLFPYFWLVFLSTTIFRWNFNFDYQYNAIFSPSKSFFVLVYFVLNLTFGFSFIKQSKFRRLILAVSCLFVVSYFINYFNGINYWKTTYQNTILAGDNYKTQSKAVAYRNLTFREGYANMVNQKLLIPTETPFEKIDLEKIIADSAYVTDLNTGVSLFEEASKNEVNMYDISIKPIVLYSYNFPFKGNWTNRMDGVYFYLTSPNDKFILPTRYVTNSPVNFFFRRQPFNTNWLIGTVENSFSLETEKATYDIYLLEVIDNKFTRLININKSLRVKNVNEYEILESK